MTADSLARIAHARLRALRDNIPDQTTVGTDYIFDYHEIVSSLESLGVKLPMFKIPPTAIHTEDGVTWCHSSFFKAKVEGLLNLFDISQTKEGTQIGFRPPT